MVLLMSVKNFSLKGFGLSKLTLSYAQIRPVVQSPKISRFSGTICTLRRLEKDRTQFLYITKVPRIAKKHAVVLKLCIYEARALQTLLCNVHLLAHAKEHC